MGRIRAGFSFSLASEHERSDPRFCVVFLLSIDVPVGPCFFQLQLPLPPAAEVGKWKRRGDVLT